MQQSPIALKLESKQRCVQLLEQEWAISQLLKEKPGRVKALDYSEREHNFNILVLPLMGPDLGKIRRRCGGAFSLRTSLLVLEQLLHRIQDLHNDGYVHRDIQPLNCVVGRGRSGNVIHLIDYGIAARAMSEQEPRATTDSDFSLLLGTREFASTSAFHGHGKLQAVPRLIH